MGGFKPYYAGRVDHTCYELDGELKNREEARILSGIWLELLRGW